MARRVKNQSAWITEQRKNRKKWSDEIRAHSAEAAEELEELERDYPADVLFAHPERFEGSRERIREYMEALRDIHRGITREKITRLEGPREEAWREREKERQKEWEKEQRRKKREKEKEKRPAKKKPTVARKPRPTKAKEYTDPATGETLYIVESVKHLGANVGGVTFDVHKVDTDKGPRYRFNVTKRGRRIEHRKGAPPLYDHPDEKRLFKNEEDAMLRARRVIHAALIWYEERRGKEREIEEKKRMVGRRKKFVEEVRARVKPRVAMHKVKPGTFESDVLGLEPGTYVKEERLKAKDVAKIKREWEEKERRRKRKRTPRKVSKKPSVAAWEVEEEIKVKGVPEKRKVPAGARRTKKPAEVKKRKRIIEAKVVGGKFRTPKKMLKGNPIFGADTSDVERQARKSIENFDKSFLSWKRSVKLGRSNNDALLRAYDWLENARANYSLMDAKAKAKAIQAKKEEVRDVILAIMGESELELSLNPGNPSSAAHQKIGSKALSASEKAWDRYCEKLQAKDLLDAYKHLIIAEQELGYVKDKKGLSQAKAGLKAARAELASHLKKKAAKKTSKKKPKKKTSKKKAK